MKVTSPRGRILEEARRLTEGDRNKAHGDPKPNMECFIDLVNSYISGVRCGNEAQLGSADAAIIMCLFKIARIASNQDHADSYIDLAAYAAIAAECAGIDVEVFD